LQGFKVSLEFGLGLLELLLKGGGFPGGRLAVRGKLRFESSDAIGMAGLQFPVLGEQFVAL
jgi:hypothetical protein